MQTGKEETTNWAVGYSAWMTKQSIARKIVKPRGWKSQLSERRDRIERKAIQTEVKKVFIKGWTNHGVWKLINAGNIQLESWWKRVRKERNYQSVQTLAAGRCVLFDRKKEKNKTTGMNVWSTMARSDGMIRESQPENRIAPNFKRDYALIRTVSLWKEWWSSIAREKGAKPDKNLHNYVRKKLVYIS